MESLIYGARQKSILRMAMKSLYALIFSIYTVMLCLGCGHNKIEITSQYIINENWSAKEAAANHIVISKLTVKKANEIDPFSKLTQAEILEKLEEDSSVLYYANIKTGTGEGYKGKKIYFNSDNGFYWRVGGYRQEDSTKIIGVLQKDSWYKFSGLLNYPFFVYVYVDSVGIVHRFDINLANY